MLYMLIRYFVSYNLFEYIQLGFDKFSLFVDSNLVTAKIVQQSNGSMNIDALISSISIIISVEFLVSLADFFTSAIPSDTKREADLSAGNVGEALRIFFWF